MADNDFSGPGENVLSGIMLAESKGQNRQGEILALLFKDSKVTRDT